MSNSLTDKQRNVLSKYEEFITNCGKPPTYRELAKQLGGIPISSVQTHVEAIRKKGLLGSSLANTPVYMSLKLNNILSVLPQQIENVSEVEAVEIFGRLLFAEANKLNISVTDVVISTNTKAGDGGVDAKVTANHAIARNDLIPTNKTCYQIKSGKFRPTESNFKKELVKKDGRLKPMVEDAIKNGYAYVFCCFGQDYTPAQNDKGLEFIKKIFSDYGFNDVMVKILSQNQICSCINNLPSLCSEFFGCQFAPLETYSVWSKRQDMRLIFSGGPDQIKLIEKLRLELRQFNNTENGIIVFGSPGIGKTRLMLEVLKADDLQPFVLYCDKPELIVSNQLLSLMRQAGNSRYAILVIDECGRRSVQEVITHFQGYKNLRLVIIANDPPQSAGSGFYQVEPLDKKQLGKVISSYGCLDEHESERWAEFCSGFPRVAHIIGETLRDNPNGALSVINNTSDIWEKIISGFPDQNAERREILRHLALFKRFSIDGKLKNEGEFILRLIKEKYPSIGESLLRNTIDFLKDKKLIQGYKTLYFTPQALHIWLWQDWWKNYGEGFSYQEFTKAMPESLFEPFKDMLVYGSGVDGTSAIIDQLLGDSGQLSNWQYLNTENGSSLFLAITNADAGKALQCLQKVVSKLSDDDLINTKESRRSLIWAIERIIAWKDLFEGGMQILQRFSENEIETYDNNAVGVYCQAFVSILAPTEASYKLRLNELKRILSSSSDKAFELGLKACGSALQNGGQRTVGAEHQGLKTVQLPYSYNPNELMEYYESVWKILIEQFQKRPNKEQEIVSIINNCFRGLLSVTPLVELMISDLKSLYLALDRSSRNTLIDCINSALRYDGGNLTEKNFADLETLKVNLVGKSSKEKIKYYSGVESYKLENEKGENTALNDIAEICQIIVSDPSKYKEELAWIFSRNAKNGYLFAAELSKLDKSQKIIDLVLPMIKKNGHEQFDDYALGGYLSVLAKNKPESFKACMHYLVADSFFVEHMLEITWRSDSIDDDMLLALIDLAKKKLIAVKKFNGLRYGRSLHRVDQHAFSQLIAFLLSNNSVQNSRLAIGLCSSYYLHNDKATILSENQVFEVLTNKYVFEDSDIVPFGTMDNYHWECLLEEFLKAYPNQGFEILTVVVNHFGCRNTVIDDMSDKLRDILISIIKTDPHKSWQIVKEALGPPINVKAMALSHWLGGGLFHNGGHKNDDVFPINTFNQEDVWNWVDKNVEERAWYLANFVPTNSFYDEKKGFNWVREILVRYGDREDVQRNLMSNFETVSFSGSASLYHENKKSKMQKILDVEDNNQVRKWLRQYIEVLGRNVEHEREYEERMW